MYSQATKRPWQSKPTHNETMIPEKEYTPGQCVAVDMLKSPTPGLIAQLTGRLTKDRYKYATVYVDVATGYGTVVLQKTANAEETIKGKEAFERHAKACGIKIQHYHANNGTFRANAWREHCHEQGQTLSFASVHAHFENGVAERRIRLLQDLARTMMTECLVQWPQSASPTLWSYAIRYAHHNLNNSPSLRLKGHPTPLEAFSGEKTRRDTSGAVPFSCPVYSTAASIINDKPHNKWAPRSKMGMYLGVLPLHSQRAGLILNLSNRLVSPQFHYRPDRGFTTVKPDPHHLRWKAAAGLVDPSTKQPNPDAAGNLLTPTKKSSSQKSRSEDNTSQTRRKSNKRRRTGKPESTVRARATTRKPPAQVKQKSNGRVAKISAKESILANQHLETSNGDNVHNSTEETTLELLQALEEPMNIDDSMMAMKANSDLDSMYYHEAMRQVYKKKFMEARDREFKSLSDNKTYTVRRRDEIPTSAKVLPMVWQMRRKRCQATGKIRKYKARLNVDGSRMVKGLDYTEA